MASEEENTLKPRKHWVRVLPSLPNPIELIRRSESSLVHKSDDVFSSTRLQLPMSEVPPPSFCPKPPKPFIRYKASASLPLRTSPQAGPQVDSGAATTGESLQSTPQAPRKTQQSSLMPDPNLQETRAHVDVFRDAMPVQGQNKNYRFFLGPRNRTLFMLFDLGHYDMFRSRRDYAAVTVFQSHPTINDLTTGQLFTGKIIYFVAAHKNSDIDPRNRMVLIILEWFCFQHVA